MSEFAHIEPTTRQSEEVILTALETLDEVLALRLAAHADTLLLTLVNALLVFLRRGLLCLLGRSGPTPKEHVGETVTDSRADSDTRSGGSHLTEKTGGAGLLLLSHSRRLLAIRLRMLLVRLLLLLLRRGHCVCATRTRRC